MAKLKRLSGEHFVGAVEQRFAMHRAAGDTAGEAAYIDLNPVRAAFSRHRPTGEPGTCELGPEAGRLICPRIA